MQSRCAARWVALCLLVCFVPSLFPVRSAADAVSPAAYNRSVQDIPKSEGVLGSAGTGQVNLAYGFALPPAPFAPSLALSYSSLGGDSDVGYGWSLSVTSPVSAGFVIARDVGRGTPRLSAEDDSYVVDGAPLIRVGGSAASGELVFEAWGDASRTRYTLSKATNEWVVSDLSGSVRRYSALMTQDGIEARDTDQDLEAPVRLTRRAGVVRSEDRTAWDKTVMWSAYLDENRFGDQIEYAYEGVSWHPETVPTLVEIRYGGNVRSGVKAPFLVSIGRYDHGKPEALTGLGPEDPARGQVQGGSLIVNGRIHHRYGGYIRGTDGQRIWGIAASVADGGTTDSGVFARAGSMVRYWGLFYNRDRIGGMNLGEAHAALERIVPFGFNPQTGQAEPEPVQRYEYNSWERTWTAIRHVMPPSSVMAPLALAEGEVPSVFPSFQTSLGGDPAKMDELGVYDADATPHWPSDVYVRGSGRGYYADRAPGPSSVQRLSDETGDGIPDFVNVLQMRACNTFAAGSQPLFFRGRSDGSFEASAARVLAWGSAVQRQTLLPSSNGVYCGLQLSRPSVVTEYRGSDFEAAPPAAFLNMSMTETFEYDVNADGFADVVRLVGQVPTRGDVLVAPAADVSSRPVWQVYEHTPYSAEVAAPRALVSLPWTEGDIELFRSPTQTVSATSTNPDGSGFDWTSNELAMADMTGDGIPDRFGAMRVTHLRNNPIADDTGYGEAPRAVEAQWAIVLYRGKWNHRASGARYGLEFETTPEYWMTDGSTGHFGEGPWSLPPSPNETLTIGCYAGGTGASREHACEQQAIGTSALIDVDSDGLLDIVTSKAKYKRRAKFLESGAVGLSAIGYVLGPLRVYYNTGLGFRDEGFLRNPSSTALPIATSYSRTNPAGDEDAVRYDRTEEMFLDWQGDGLIDIVGPHSVRVGGGGTISAPLAVAMPRELGETGFREVVRVAAGGAVRTHQQQIVDMNADGRPDILQIEAGGGGYVLYTDAGLAPGRMRASYDGLGGVTSYAYKTIAQALEETGSRGVPAVGWVVDTVTTNPGPSLAGGGPRSTKYTYSGGVFQPSSVGRDDGLLASHAAGFLGFSVVTAEGPTRQKQVSHYDYRAGREGLLTQEESLSAGGQLLSRTQYEYRQLHVHDRPAPDGVTLQPPDVSLPTETRTETWMEVGPGVYAPEPVVTRTRYEYPSSSAGALAYGGAPMRVLEDNEVANPQDDIITETRYGTATFSDARGAFRTLVPLEEKSYGYSAESERIDRVLRHIEHHYDCDPDRETECDAFALLLSETDGVGAGSRTLTRGLLRQDVVFTDPAAPDDREKTLRTKYHYDLVDGRLAWTTGPSGRTASVCYDPKRLYAVVGLAANRARQEGVIDLGTGATVELSGPVGLPSSTALDGSPRPVHCPQVDRGEPRFGGVDPTIPSRDKQKTFDPTPLATGGDLPAEPAPSGGVGGGADAAEPPAIPPYGRVEVFGWDSVAAALRDRRRVPPGEDAAHAYVTLPRLFAMTTRPRATLSRSGAWPTAPLPFEARTHRVPATHAVYDGLGLVRKTFSTTDRNPDGTLGVVQQTESAALFGDGVTGIAGVLHAGTALVAGDGFAAPNAKKRAGVVFSDGAGQTHWSFGTVGDGGAMSGGYAFYGIRGFAELALSPDPQSPGGWVTTWASDFDDTDRPRRQHHSAGREQAALSTIAWREDGPHFFSRSYSTVAGSGDVLDVEVEAIPRLRKVIQRRFTDSTMTERIETTTVYDVSGHVASVVSAEGQRTDYAYDLVGRPVRVTRFNSATDAMSAIPLETTTHLYPDQNTDSVERFIQERTSRSESGAETVARAVTEVDARTGMLLSIRKPPPSSAMSIVGYGDVYYQYGTNPDEDGYLLPSFIKSGAEDIRLTYDGRQRPKRVERHLHARFPGPAGADPIALDDTVVYRMEYDQAGALLRAHVDVHDRSTMLTFTERLTYDDAGHLQEILDETPAAGRTPARETFAYNHVGLPRSRSDHRGGIRTIEYDHYGAPRTSVLTAPELGGTGMLAESLTPDPRTGLPVAHTTTRADGAIRTWSYTYNGAAQLTHATGMFEGRVYQLDTTYRAQGLGAERRVDARVDHLDERVSGGAARAVRYVYRDGYDKTQLQDIRDRISDSPERAYRYDAVGAVTETSAVDASGAVSPTGAFANDALGEVWSHDQGGYLYGAGGDRIAEYTKNANGLPDRLYVSLPLLELEYRRDETGNFNRPSVIERYVGSSRIGASGSTEDAFAEFDMLGNPMMQRRTGPADNAEVAYTPFGQEIPDLTHGWGGEPIGFKGGRTDRTGQHQVRFGTRNYDPATGLWLSRDTIRNGLAENAYAAFANNPVAFADPDGRQVMPRNPPGPYVREAGPVVATGTQTVVVSQPAQPGQAQTTVTVTRTPQPSGAVAISQGGRPGASNDRVSDNVTLQGPIAGTLLTVGGLAAGLRVCAAVRYSQVAARVAGLSGPLSRMRTLAQGMLGGGLSWLGLRRGRAAPAAAAPPPPEPSDEEIQHQYASARPCFGSPPRPRYPDRTDVGRPPAGSRFLDSGGYRNVYLEPTPDADGVQWVQKVPNTQPHVSIRPTIAALNQEAGWIAQLRRDPFLASRIPMVVNLGNGVFRQVYTPGIPLDRMPPSIAASLEGQRDLLIDAAVRSGVPIQNLDALPQNMHAVSNGDGTWTVMWVDPVTPNPAVRP